MTDGTLITFANANSYTSYKIMFPTLKDVAGAAGMQISGLQLFDSSVPGSNADFNSDGRVDGADFLVWQRGLGLTSQTNKQNGDANGDGSVTAADFTVWKSQFGTTPGVAAAGAVPEPATVGLAVISGLAVAACGRRGRRKSS